MYGESKENNNLFYTCSLLEYISRKTFNKLKDVIKKIDKKNIEKIYFLADVYHAENIDKIADELIQKCNIEKGNYDKLSKINYKIPSYFEIGRIYQQLIIKVATNEKDYINTLITVLSSWIINSIDNYNSDFYYKSPEYIYECYKEHKII